VGEEGDPGTAGFYERVYDLVLRVPPGQVTTYGDIALALGWPRHARLVGYALAICPGGIPAHRVVNHRGEASPAWGGGHPEEQRALLRAEGVSFTREGRVDLRRHICDLLAMPDTPLEGGGCGYVRE
jgi:methylated-DNA-protein-cysteine methyltransferase-like protein